MAKKKDEITIRSSAAEYLTYVASVGDQQDSMQHLPERQIYRGFHPAVHLPELLNPFMMKSKAM